LSIFRTFTTSSTGGGSVGGLHGGHTGVWAMGLDGRGMASPGAAIGVSVSMGL